MSHDSRFDQFVTKYARALIRTKAAQLSRRPGFTRSDRDDLSQRLWTAVFEQADKFDPTRASIDTFVDRVVNTAVGMLLRERRCEKRAAGAHAQSLDQVAGDGESPLRDQLDDADRCRRLGTVPADPVQALIDEDAFAHAMASSPDEHRDTMRRVMGGSMSAASRELGTSRRQVRNTLDESRSGFERAGFGNSES